MIICGIKVTHDGGIALIDNGELKFSIEMEKINNNHRYSGLTDLSKIPELLAEYGYSPDMVDHFVVDGWHGTGAHWRGEPVLEPFDGDTPLKVTVAPYNELVLTDNILKPHLFEGGLSIQGKTYDYRSYMHVAGHVCSTYATSPYAKNGEPSFVLVWDGGQYPRLYYVDPEAGTIQNLGHLFFILGTMYSVMGHYFGPYKKSEEELRKDREQMTIEGYFGGYSIAGKLMSYIAFGEPDETLIQELDKIYKKELEISNLFEHKFMTAVSDYVAGKGFSDASVLASMHVFLERMLLKNLAKKVKKYPDFKRNFCFSGGSALNIKWNSKIRDMGLFNGIWVPPVPNDAGSAIGAACSAMAELTGRFSIDWTVYSGPKLRSNEPQGGWEKRPCNIPELAAFLAEIDEPLVFLSGNAELGPRALGNRSILAPANHPEMQAKLNCAKLREEFRPVAPICLEAYAADVFDPGDADPYMLFDHKVRESWKEKVPAIVHLDGTARLQTVNKEQNETIWQLLTEYRAITGIPLLCNTSANLNGSGFFPDIESAARWGRSNYIWSEGMLYEQVVKFQFETVQSNLEVPTV
ncbi:MAG: nodulation protein U [Saprospiraceae bacterium]|nr:MAG: nodulation protein U [Saprospiraceae bacterium]